MPKKLTHFDPRGRAHMVDVGEKAETDRVAIAGGCVLMAPATLRLIKSGKAKKGDVLGVARLAAIAGLKRTSDLIPLCHPVRVTGVEVELAPRELPSPRVEILATVRAHDRTGVEMEALTAVGVAALTIYDMCKAVDRGMTINEICVLEKRGGKSVAWTRR